MKTLGREAEGRGGRLKLDPGSGAGAAAFADALDRLEKERAVERIWAEDASFWKSEESHRKIIDSALGWLTIADRMEAGIPELRAFAADVSRNAERVVVLGMGGSSLAPLVFSDSFPPASGAPRLEVLDSTEPASVLATLHGGSAARTIYVVSSKSGTTLEPNIFFDFFYAEAQKELGEKAGDRFVVVTDPGSALEKEAGRRRVRRIFPGDPRIGGRYSALSNFGIVPAALAGIDVGELLRRARRMAAECRKPGRDNPGLALGAAMASLALAGRDKLTFDIGAPIGRFGMWTEQLVAESTGKEGKGILPVEGEPLGGSSDYGARSLLRGAAPLRGRGRVAASRTPRLGGPSGRERRDRRPARSRSADVPVGVRDRRRRPRPRDQSLRPAERPGGEGPDQRDPGRAGGADSRAKTSADRDRPERALESRSGPSGRAIILPSWRTCLRRRSTSSCSTETRLRVRDRKRIATTVGFGPRFLHSTGQLHKGGPPSGVFLQITAEPREDVAIPGKPWGFARVVAAQAAGISRRSSPAAGARRMCTSGPTWPRGSRISTAPWRRF